MGKKRTKTTLALYRPKKNEMKTSKREAGGYVFKLFISFVFGI